MSEDQVNLTLSYRQITAELDNCESSEQALRILREEIAGPNRPAFVSRIYGRYDVMRRQEERLDLAHAATGDVAHWLRPVVVAPGPGKPASKPASKGAATPVQGGAGKAASGAGKAAKGRAR